VAEKLYYLFRRVPRPPVLCSICPDLASRTCRRIKRQSQLVLLGKAIFLSLLACQTTVISSTSCLHSFGIGSVAPLRKLPWSGFPGYTTAPYICARSQIFMIATSLDLKDVYCCHPLVLTRLSRIAANYSSSRGYSPWDWLLFFHPRKFSQADQTFFGLESPFLLNSSFIKPNSCQRRTLPRCLTDRSD
jgi:hypothetical protein